MMTKHGVRHKKTSDAACSLCLEEALIEPGVWRCSVRDAPASWPHLHVLMVDSNSPETHNESSRRAVARERVRELLLRHAGPAITAPLLGATSSARGAQRTSISHEKTHSMLAWCDRGCIGIDTVGMQALASIGMRDLDDMARLYLGPTALPWADAVGGEPPTRRRFADAWARHEAQLKCLGLALDEWSPALQTKLAACQTAAVTLPTTDRSSSGQWVAWIAWCSEPSDTVSRPEGVRFQACLGRMNKRFTDVSGCCVQQAAPPPAR